MISKFTTKAELLFLQATKWLFVFDNVDDIELLREFWPLGKHGNVILTSRDPCLYTVDLGDLQNIQVKPLNQQESLSLLYSVAERDENAQHGHLFDKIFVQWGGVPIAINQMGVFIKNNFLSLDDFAALYQESFRMIHDHTNVYDSYPHSVATAFSVEKLDKKARSILHLLSYFDPDSIPGGIVYSSFQGHSVVDVISTRFEYVTTSPLSTTNPNSFVAMSKH